MRDKTYDIMSDRYDGRILEDMRMTAHLFAEGKDYTVFADEDIAVALNNDDFDLRGRDVWISDTKLETAVRRAGRI